MNKRQQILSSIPAVDELLKQRKIENLIFKYPRSIVVDSIREYLSQYRQYILSLGDDELTKLNTSSEVLIDGIIAGVHKAISNKLKNVVNATGVVIHTNLGRAALTERAKENLWSIACGYSNLEYDLENGSRGSRYSHVEALICKLTGAEAAMVVNNNAAAVMLVLSTLAKDMEVIVSRGQLVEIGGSFRVPDVMAQSGAILR